MRTGFPRRLPRGPGTRNKKDGDASMIGFSVQAIERGVSPEYVRKFPIAAGRQCQRLHVAPDRRRATVAAVSWRRCAFRSGVHREDARPGDNLMVHKALDIASSG